MFSRRALLKIENIAVYVILVMAVILAVFPIAWTVSTSFKSVGEYYTYPPVWIPKNPTIANYTYIISTAGLDYLRNSLIIASLNLLLVLGVSIPAAYGIARFRVGGENLSFWILSQRMLPPVATIIPFFLLFRGFQLFDRQITLLDKHLGLILVYCTFNIAFAVWLLIGFFESFPAEIEEAAVIDGCSRIGAVLRVVIPVIAPGIVVTGLFCFIFSWNEFLFALILTREAAKTVTLQLSQFRTPTKILWGEMSALSLITIIPILVIVVFIQRYLVKGLAFGAVKG